MHFIKFGYKFFQLLTLGLALPKIEFANSLHNQSYSCSQYVLTAFADEHGLDKETTLKISSTFGGGMGHTADTCGTVTGTVIAIDMKFGYPEIADRFIKFHVEVLNVDNIIDVTSKNVEIEKGRITFSRKSWVDSSLLSSSSSSSSRLSSSSRIVSFLHLHLILNLN